MHLTICTYLKSSLEARGQTQAILSEECYVDCVVRNYILDLQVGHVGGEAQKNILLVLLWAPTNVGENHCQVCPWLQVKNSNLINMCTI